MTDLPNPLTMRPVTDHDAALWQELFCLAGQLDCPTLRAKTYAGLVCCCLRLNISMHEVLSRAVRGAP